MPRLALEDDQRSGAPAPVRRRTRSRRAALSAGLVLTGILIGAAVVAGSRDTGARMTGGAAGGGCELHASQYGYPDWYIRHRQIYQDHPPLPAFGWHGPSEQIDFNVLFHSVFHGYTVVQYRPGISSSALATLRQWVDQHAEERVTSAQAEPGAPFAVDVAKWGHELGCTSDKELNVQELDELLAR